MKIFINLDPKDNRLPKDNSAFVKPKPHRKVPFVDPSFFVQNNPRVKANLAQFDNINPSKIRSKTKERLAQQVESINRHLQKFKTFKGISFELDEASGRTFAVVKNKRTGEVLKQFPASENLQRAAILKDVSGLLKDVKI